MDFLLKPGHFQRGQAQRVLQLYAQMREQGVSPNNRTFVCTLQAFGLLADQEEDVMIQGQLVKGKSFDRGKAMYADACRKGCGADVFVGTTAISMFAKCGSFADAQNVFDDLSHSNVVPWNAMLNACVEQGQAEEALEMYGGMADQGVKPDAWTYVRVIQACGMLADKDKAVLVDGSLLKVKSLYQGRVLHAALSAQGLNSDVFVNSALVSVYGKCWSIADAKCSFDTLSQHDVVVWNALLRSYAEQRQGENAIGIYVQMREESTSPDVWTFVSALHACHIFAEQEREVIVDGVPMRVNSLGKGKAIHADAEVQGHNTNVFLGTVLVTLYGKCGSMADAQHVFDKLPKRDVVAWNSMLAAHIEQNEAEQALKLYELFIQEDLSPDAWTFASILQAYSMLAKNDGNTTLVEGQFVKVNTLMKGEAVHAEIRKKGFDSNVFVCTALIAMYGSCGSTRHAQGVFNQLSTRSVVTWNAMLAVYVGHGHAEKALQLYEQMWKQGVSPDAWTFVNSIQACTILAESEEEGDAPVDGRSAKLLSLAKGATIHGDAQRKGYGSDVFVGNTLITMYGKCWSVKDAQDVFDGLADHGLVTWNSLLAAYVEQGQGESALQLYQDLLQEGVSADDRTIVVALQACGIEAENEELGKEIEGSTAIRVEWLTRVKTIHHEISRKGYDANVFVGSTLISVYGKCGSLVDAQNVFDKLDDRTVVSWNAMLAAHVELGQAENVLTLYERMQEGGVSPSSRTFVSALQACGLLADKEEAVMLDGQCTKVDSLNLGMAMHAHTRIRGSESDVFVANTLMSMYGKCGKFAGAWSVFNQLCNRRTVSWNVMLAVHVEHGQAKECLQLYSQMLEEGVLQDRRTFVSTLQACGMLAEKEVEVVVDGNTLKVESLSWVKAVHANVHSYGFSTDVFVGTTLISVYGKCGSTVDAWHVFNALPERNVVSFNAMLVAFVEQDQAEQALQLYTRMSEQEGTEPDEITVVCFLQACSRSGRLGVLRQTHEALLVSAGKQELSSLLGNTLISAYGRCGSLTEAQAAFDALPQPDVVSWNALIAAYARQGQSAACLGCYDRLCSAGVKPDGVTFLSLLSACSHAGLVDKGAEYFDLMTSRHGIAPETRHFDTMVDLFGRAGRFARVEALLLTMPGSPDLVMWLCLLGACRKHSNVVLGEQAFRGAVRLHPQHPAAYVLMANIYADAGLMDEAEKAAKLREAEGAWKNPGRCWIQHKQDQHSFLVGTLEER